MRTPLCFALLCFARVRGMGSPDAPRTSRYSSIMLTGGLRSLLSLPGGESWGASGPNPPRACAHLQSTGVFSPPHYCVMRSSAVLRTRSPLPTAVAVQKKHQRLGYTNLSFSPGSGLGVVVARHHVRIAYPPVLVAVWQLHVRKQHPTGKC